MFYRLRRSLRYLKFHRQISRLMETPPLRVADGPVTIVSMVAAYDVRMYILAIKALYRRLGSGKLVVLSDEIPDRGLRLIRRHIPDIEIVPVKSIDTGEIQRGGTWERLVYCVERSATDYVIQMDADVLCVGPIEEVISAAACNRAFLLADGIGKKPLNAWVKDAEARKSDNIVIAFEKEAPRYPDSEKLLYLRGSSGFAGFARGAIDRRFLREFYAKSRVLMGARWSEWGTEQIASNFCIANSPDSLGLPVPKFLTWENHHVSPETSVYHFLGYCRFDKGLFATLANREIDAMLAPPEKAQ